MKFYIKKPTNTLFRFINDGKEFSQQVWLPHEKRWIESINLGDYLLFGEVDLYDIDAVLAQKMFPEAFQTAEAPIVDDGSSPIAI